MTDVLHQMNNNNYPASTNNERYTMKRSHLTLATKGEEVNKW
jgi:hypothetical protein